MEALMDHAIIDINTVTDHFKALSSVVPLHAIHTEQDYDKAVSVLNLLLDAGAANEAHPLSDLVDTLGTLIGEYEDIHYQPEKVSPVDMLRFFMTQHNLTQSNIPEIGTQGVVSEILSGKRNLNVRQIYAISQRFNVPAHLFMQ